MNPLFISNVNIVDVCCGRIKRQRGIFIENGKISYLCDETDVECADKFDGRNKWAIPAFVDCHAHLTFDGYSHSDYSSFTYDESVDLSLMRGAYNVSSALDAGISLVRDLGAKAGRTLKLKRLVDEGILFGPDIVLAGEPVCVRSGHGYEFGVCDVDKDYLANHFNTDHEWLKVMNGPELFQFGELVSFVEMAHEAGLHVAAHVFTEQGIRNCITAGVNTIEHAVPFTSELEQIAWEKCIRFTPTFYCSWRSLRGQYAQTIPTKELEYLRQWRSFLVSNFERYVKSGLPTLAGTDAGAAPCSFSDITYEMVMLNKHGLPTLHSLQSGTIEAAKALNRESSHGSIDQGKYANIVLVNENPLEHLDTILNIQAFWHKGIEIRNKVETPWN